MFEGDNDVEDFRYEVISLGLPVVVGEEKKER